jgi:hypothetical protein
MTILSDDFDDLSMPVAFIKGAQKRGWNALHFRVSQNHIHLILDEWRIRFVKISEKKFWILSRAGESGWSEMHSVFHPGTSRLEWVLVTFGKLISHFERIKHTEPEE